MLPVELIPTVLFKDRVLNCFFSQCSFIRLFFSIAYCFWSLVKSRAIYI